MELSKKDRLMLYNQYEIIKLLTAEDLERVEYCENIQKVLEYGFKRDYDTLLNNFGDDVGDEITSFVWDVLTMYWTFHISYEKFTQPEKDAIDFSQYKFRGFDGNEEFEHYAYSNYILKDLKRFEPMANGCEYNSHFPTINRYRALLEKFHSMNLTDNIYLSKEQMLELR